MVTRIEQPRSRLCVFLLGIVFLSIFMVLLGIGDGAPEVVVELISTDDDGTVDLTGNGKNLYMTSFDLSKENQLFWVDMRLSTGDLEEDQLPETMELNISTEVLEKGDTMKKIDEFSLVTTQVCRQGEDWCDWFFLWNRDFVEHDSYLLSIGFTDPDEYLTSESSSSRSDALFEVETRVTAINPEFTQFEIAFKYLWLAITLMVMFCPCGAGFRSALKRQRKDTGLPRTYHQRWTSVLLWALVWFDDPLVAATVYSDLSSVFSAVFILSASIFVFLILLYWLCFFSDLRFMQEGGSALEVRRGFCCYWIPKVFLTFAIGVTVFGGYIHYRFENTISFEYTGVSDEKQASDALAGVLSVLLVVYIIWTLMLVLTSCGRLRKVSPSYLLLYCVTLLSCLVAIVGVFVAAFYPYSTSEIAFVGIHGLLNIYVWTLAASFAPVRAARASGGLGMGDKPMMVETGTANGRQGNGWNDAADSDFKAVEL